MSQRPKYMHQKGISLLLVIIVLTFILSLSFGLATISLQGFKIMQGIGDSVVALYAADSGIERAALDGGLPNCTYSGNIESDGKVYASYQVNVYGKQSGEGMCSGGSLSQDGCGYDFCVRAYGTFRDVSRAIEVYTNITNIP